MQSLPLRTGGSQPGPPAPPTAPPKVILRTSILWDEAFTEIQTTKRWSLFLKIIERRHIKDANDPEAIAQILQDVQKQAESSRNGRLRLLRKPCFKLLDVLKQIKDVGAGAAALNPYASLAWTGVSFLIQAAVNNRDVEQLCWDQLPRIVSLISRHQTVEELYEVSHASTEAQKLLRDALVQMYSGMLEYQIEVVIFAGSKLEKLKAIFRDASQSAVKQASETTENRQRHVLELQSVVDREVSNGQFNKLTAGMEEVKAAIADIELLSKNSFPDIGKISAYIDSKRRDEILTWLSPYLHENSHRKTEKTASPGTGQWLLGNTQFNKWFSSQLPSALWLKGFMGSGKSCLTHLIIEHVREILKQVPNQRLAFFYCDGTDQQASSAMSDVDTIMRSMLKQLTLQDNTLHKAVFDAYERLHNSAQLTATECVDLIVEISSQSQVIFILLDGFDECSINVQRALAKQLQDLMQKATGTIRLFVSGRPSVEPRLRGWMTEEINVRENNLRDVSFLVREKVLSAANSPEFKSLYWRGEDCRAQQVIATLETHAQGMFRWVQSGLSYLHKSQHYSSMTRKLQALPKLEDLSDLYAEIWNDAIAAADEEDRKAMKTLIIFAMYGLGGPEFIEEAGDSEMSPFLSGLRHVAHAAAFMMDPITSQDHMCRSSLPDLVRLCPDFLEYEEIWEETLRGFPHDMSALRLQHVSVREFLVARHGVEYSPIAGHAFLAWLCMQYWLKHAARVGFGPYSGAWWGNHLLQVKSLAGGNLQAYLKEDHDLRRAVNAFLGGQNATEPFTKWSEWIQHQRVSLYLITSHAAASWTTKPPSTMFARIELDLPIDELSEDAIRAKGYKKIPFTARKRPQNALQFAQKVGNQKAFESLKAMGLRDSEHET